jgi:lipid II:glycine glycyltransferase (peptidoglycan interpeptide bridge formation enzyme)
VPVSSRRRDRPAAFARWQPQFTYEVPLAGRTEDDLLRGMNQFWRRNIKKAAKEGVEVSVRT